jgi:hypothetical protein
MNERQHAASYVDPVASGVLEMGSSKAISWSAEHPDLAV